MDALQMKHGDTSGRYCASEETIRSYARIDALQMKHGDTSVGTVLQKK